MMSIHKGLIWMGVACLALLWAAPTVRAQSLGELAEREKERRAREAQSGKGSRGVISEEELKKHGAKDRSRSTSADEGGSADSATASSPSGSAASATSEDSGKAYWKDRIESARSAVQAAEKRVQDAETSAREARGKVTATDYNDALQEAAERQARIADLETAKRELDDARRALEDVERESRAAGGL